MKKVLAIVLLLIFCNAVNATIVDISVTTDKFLYQPGESVVVSVTAYNPNLQSVRLTGYFDLFSYTMDGVYNWADWHIPDDAVGFSIPIQPNHSVTWNFTHGLQEMQIYPLGAGWHSVVGKVSAEELTGNNESSSRQFYVTPEPATLLLFGLGALVLRKRK